MNFTRKLQRKATQKLGSKLGQTLAKIDAKKQQLDDLVGNDSRRLRAIMRLDSKGRQWWREWLWMWESIGASAASLKAFAVAR